jgi:hypothetical protein
VTTTEQRAVHAAYMRDYRRRKALRGELSGAVRCKHCGRFVNRWGVLKVFCDRFCRRRNWEWNHPEFTRAHSRRHRQRNLAAIRARAKAYRAKNSALLVKKATRYARARPEWLREKRAQLNERRVDGLSEAYIEQLIGVQRGTATPEMIEAKRLQVVLKRLLKEKS